MRDILSDLDIGTSEEKDPVRRAQANMKRPLPKRFYKEVLVTPVPEGFAIALDGKPVRTPGRASLAVHDEELARALAAEWDAQEKEIDPARMPLTRMVNTALDGVASAPEAVFEEILRYAGSDLLCYRASTPVELVERQAELWDPFLDWAVQAYGARFALSEGVMHVAQPPEAVGALAAVLRRHSSPMMLTALHTVTAMSGSILLALALAEGEADADAVWNAAHVDEDWNISQWGEDHEAVARRAARREDMDAAARIIESYRR